ncbi:MAG: GNAT family N-acetyltransferase [Anaerolineales bacterium]|nr:GNAT family N-acetyltransferase [Anaerolineales bacterium]
MINNPGDKFIYLADQPQLLPVLADWFYAEWGHHNPQGSKQSMQDELRGNLNKDRVPLTIVWIQGSKPVASASLKIREMDTHPQYLHWLGGVFVHPDFRAQGIGSQVVEFTAAQASRLKVAELYLYTRNHENFYARLGWRVIEEPVYEGRVVSIMKRKLTVASRKEQHNDGK